MTEAAVAVERRRSSLARLLVVLAVVGLGLAAFDFFSAGSPAAQRGLVADRPPVYGRFEPGFSAFGAIALALAVLGAGASYLIARRPKVPAALFVAGAVAALMTFGAAVAMVNGDAGVYTGTFERERPEPTDYQADVHFVREVGVREFIENHPAIAPGFDSPHSRTHPPGPLVFYSLLQNAFPDNVIPRAIIVAFFASLIPIPVWFLGKALGGERAATFAVLLVAFAPAPVIFAFTSMDALYASMLSFASAFLVWGIKDRSKPWAAIAGGAVIALSSFMTYAGAFIVGFAFLYAILTRPLKEAVRSLALAAVGGLVALTVLRVGLGFDLLASYKASFHLVPDETERSYLYWLVGSPGVWLTFAGVPIAALSLWELVARRPRYLIALFLPLLAANFTKIFPGETERIGMFAYPFIAVAAGSALARWEAESGRRRPAVVAGLVLLAALQTILLEALYFNFW